MAQEQATRYPLLLVPGLLGFVRLLVYPYWFGIVKALERGGATVIPVMVSGVNSTEIRGEQLLKVIEQTVRETGVAKVNLIGHSQGALTVRYVAARRPDLVASVTSVAGPNYGSELADYLERHFPPGTLGGRVVNAVIGLLAWTIVAFETGYRGPKLPMDITASHQSLTTTGVALFNRQYPQGLPEVWGENGEELVDGVRYYSWSGILKPGVTNRGRNLIDGTNVTCRIFARTFRKERGQSDGMVGRFSSHLGTVIGDDFALDHFDIVNQTFGLVGKGADPVRLFMEHAARLKAAGL
ncbi:MULTISPECIES: esterase/lipase family protein [Pseudomonas syringae group]|uniref:Alpha/beta hydrolase n=1 Tax=Pseudomonas syringae pv. ribicola TaxID=55398 RepID=A0A0P9ZGQ2_PSESI|nr:MULTISPECIES: triacylglycerol lipase [Pseudomonas syringae group]EKN44022.1 alpha/beta hydrolase [Pseudomonas viridiflava UASWS0038]KPL63043.1 alpha/beta hydrolase [Pseudomonas viridiflava]KPY46093.1 Alpha/beta hydrolase [Pseudomonas syringae pv. ribicola]KPZ29337.1 Alpha/beta hydrolase [Pseudomonas viridiflava]MCJ8175779.1 triacylglycerol lipase [Pseudomonas viridiflava]